jgi:hypothetical protein
MIKKQYARYRWITDSPPCYFNNFIAAHDPDDIIEDELQPYKATLGKSKNKHTKLNVKWQDDSLYMMFVLRWS